MVPYLRAWLFREDRPDLLDDFDEQSREYFPDLFKRSTDQHFQPPFTWIFIGAKGSFTPLHCDVWMTDAWMAQFEGRKQFRFWHPDDLEHLLVGDHFVDLSEPDMETFPSCLQPVPMVHILEPGQIMYIPSQWAHEVSSVDDTLSVTTNFYPECRTKVSCEPYPMITSCRE